MKPGCKRSRRWKREIQGPLSCGLAGGIAHPSAPRPDGVSALRSALDRPLLVAGMVRNEGEPGGGPFWLLDDEGTLRAQIVESAEMDLGNPLIGNCIAGATHFNPVDLICVMHNDQGVPYDLSRFVDPRRDFLVSKSHAGRPLIGLEHPGLWNGSMGRWNTLFVEVPSRTFAPSQDGLRFAAPCSPGLNQKRPPSGEDGLFREELLLRNQLFMIRMDTAWRPLSRRKL